MRKKRSKKDSSTNKNCHFPQKKQLVWRTLPETDIASEIGWAPDNFIFQPSIFRRKLAAMLVTISSKVLVIFPLNHPKLRFLTPQKKEKKRINEPKRYTVTTVQTTTNLGDALLAFLRFQFGWRCQISGDPARARKTTALFKRYIYIYTRVRSMGRVWCIYYTYMSDHEWLIFMVDLWVKIPYMDPLGLYWIYPSQDASHHQDLY